MVEVERQHQGGNAHPGRSQGRFDTGMPSADHDYSEIHNGRIMARIERRAKRFGSVASCWGAVLFLLKVAKRYFPIQNSLNTASSTSSVPTSPVSAPKASAAAAASTATISGGIPESALVRAL